MSTRRCARSANGKFEMGGSVMPCSQGLPADHPDLHPIWRAAADRDLPIANHSFTWNPPYYPGYEDLWKTSSSASSLPSLGCHALCRVVHRRRALRQYRACAWVSSNAASAGCRSGAGGWTSRRSMSAARRASQARQANTWRADGSSAASEHHEGEDMFNHVTHFLGDDVLMYASDYPRTPGASFPTRSTTSWPGRASGRRRE